MLSSVVAPQCQSVAGEGMDGVEVVGCQDHSPPSVGSLCDHGHGSSGYVGWQMVGPQHAACRAGAVHQPQVLQHRA